MFAMHHFTTTSLKPTTSHAMTPNTLASSLAVSDFRQTVMPGPRHSGSYLGTIDETRKTCLALFGNPRNGGRARGVHLFMSVYPSFWWSGKLWKEHHTCSISGTTSVHSTIHVAPLREFRSIIASNLIQGTWAPVRLETLFKEIMVWTEK
jgi:hypothetical protein